MKDEKNKFLKNKIQIVSGLIGYLFIQVISFVIPISMNMWNELYTMPLMVLAVGVIFILINLKEFNKVIIFDRDGISINNNGNIETRIPWSEIKNVKRVVYIRAQSLEIEMVDDVKKVYFNLTRGILRSMKYYCTNPEVTKQLNELKLTF